MAWFDALFDGTSIPGAILALTIVIGLGLALGSVRFRGVSLGVAGVLFAGLALGHYGLLIDAELLRFLRDFGLVLFVFMIGLQVGPGFLDSLRREGLRLNALSLLGIVVSVALAWVLIKRMGFAPAAGIGMLAGATTNTPSLAAGQDALKIALSGAPAGADHAKEAARLAGLAYAIAYPAGVLAPIGVMLVLRVLLRIDVAKELTDLVPPRPTRLARIALVVREPGAIGRTIAQLHGQTGVTISRLYREGRTTVPTPDVSLRAGDMVMAVGPSEQLADFEPLIGPRSPLDLRAMTDKVVSRRVVIPPPRVLGRTLAELKLRERMGVTVTRIVRSGVEIPAVGGLTLNYADGLVLVGPPEEVQKAGAELGDAPRALDYPHFVPIVVGIGLGVLIGSIPIAFPGMPAGVRLGLAGGPLLVAIVVSRLGRLGPLVWYMPPSANFALREGGLALFLAAIGLSAGPTFVETLRHGGLTWLGAGAIVTIGPMLAVSLFARLVLKMNFVLITGLIAGHGTQPAVLNFATSLCKNDAPGIAYAAVYPLTLLLRVVCVQLLVQALLAG